MKRYNFSPASNGNRGHKLAVVVVVAVGCLIAGMMISANLDVSTPVVAQAPINIAQTGPYPVVQHDGQFESPFVAVVERVQDAVVNISARSRTREDVLPWWHRGSNYATSQGSGFFFREDGYILTNNHVVKNAVQLTVRTASGYDYEAELVGADPATDLAVLKVSPEEPITTIPFGDSDALKVGDWAIAIGNPFPQQGLYRTVTVGVISAKGRSNLNFGRETPQYQHYIQTDASINPGNSGGPLLNLLGECIGVNAAISTPTGGSVGIGFAIPINLGRAIVPDLIAHGRVSRGWLGVWLSDVTEREAKRQGLEAVRGVRIDSVFSGSPADRAGLRSGDIVVGFEDREVTDASQLSILVSTIDEGSLVSLEVVREGEHLSLTTGIGDRDTFLASQNSGDSRDDFYVVRWLGMELMNITDEIAEALSLEAAKGVYVRRVYSGSPADRASITKGTIILQVAKRTTKSLEDIEKVADSMRQDIERIALIVQEPDGTIVRKVIRR
ncbi:MAG: trypsin-like peptidase domain-containing protein [bacterium]